MSAIAVERPQGRYVEGIRRGTGRAALFVVVLGSLWGLWEGYRALWSHQGWTWPFVVDNTPPTLTPLEVTQHGRKAVLAFRAAGKPVYAWLSSGGEAEYLLASAAGTIAMPPSATLQLDGLTASALFLKGTFEKLSITPNFAHAGRYKSAVEQYTRSEMSEPSRAAMEALLDDEYRLLVDSLASARGLPPGAVEAAR